MAGSTEHKVKRPLNRRIFLVTVIFIVILCITISLATYAIFKNAMLDRYQKQLKSLVDYVESNIDVDDMYECATSLVESEKYKEFQAFFDDLIDHYSDIHYLYILRVVDPDEKIPVIEICAANSTYEKENDPDLVLHLGDGEEGWHTKEVVQKMFEIQHGSEDGYFINSSDWGVDYTLARPLISSSGDHYAIICADVSIDELNSVIYKNINIVIAIIFGSGVLFIILLSIWIHFSVIKPLKQLEGSVYDFAATSATITDPEELVFNAPVIRAQNEVGSLSAAVKKLSLDMRNYIKGMIEAEKESKALQEHVTEISEVAYQDALTKVKNKASYNQKEQTLVWDIDNESAEFAFVMIDLNNLKVVNDKYGHEHGDEYIKGSSAIICNTYKNSPVYRIGGDEFIVILENNDYERRDELLEKLRKRFDESASNQMVEPWFRYSAAAGMAIYEEGDNVDTVFSRADHEMYMAKKEMKARKKKD